MRLIWDFKKELSLEWPLRCGCRCRGTGGTMHGGRDSCCVCAALPCEQYAGLLTIYISPDSFLCTIPFTGARKTPNWPTFPPSPQRVMAASIRDLAATNVHIKCWQCIVILDCCNVRGHRKKSGWHRSMQCIQSPAFYKQSLLTTQLRPKYQVGRIQIYNDKESLTANPPLQPISKFQWINQSWTLMSGQC